MAELHANIDMAKLMTEVTMYVHVKRHREFTVRAWLGTRLAKLAARVLGCKVEFTHRGY